MKIGIVTFGFNTSSMPLARYLSGTGNTVDLYCLMHSVFKDHFTIDLSKHKISNGFLSRKMMDKIIDKSLLMYLEPLNDFNIYLYSRKRRNLYAGYYYRILLLSFYLRKQRYDIIHFIGQVPDFIYITRLLPKPKIYTFHEVIDYTADNKQVQNSLVRFVSCRLNNVILHSGNIRDKYLLNFNPRNRGINVIRFGLFETYKLFPDNTPEETCTLLYYGIIRPYKGLEYLLDAFKIVKESIAGVKLIIAGRGEVYFDRNKLLDEQIEFINRSVSEEEVVRLNRRATVVICPYVSASQSGIPMTSFNFIKPIIASDVEGISEYVTDNYNGLLVPPEDIECLASKIIQLLKDDNLRARIKENIVKMNQDNHRVWSEIANRTLEIYCDEINSADRLK